MYMLTGYDYIMSTIAQDDVLTLGEISLLVGVPECKLRRLFQTGQLTEPRRCGNRRAFLPEDQDRLRRELRERGLLPSRSAASATPA
jgi:hypothetical protein